MKLTEKNIQTEYGLAVDQYGALESRRRSLEYLWKEASKLTLPHIFPEEGITESAELPTPYNSVGAAGVNALSSKLLLTLLPPTGNFFRLLPYEEDLAELEEEGKAEVDKLLSKIEQDILMEIDRKNLRVPLFEAMKFLIITGNTMLYKVPNGGLKAFSPYQYVVERDYVGNILKTVIKEPMAYTALPPVVQDIISIDMEAKKEDTDIDIYTVILRTSNDSFTTYQEVQGTMIPGTFKKYKENMLPYIVLRWTSSSSEYYGRGLVEQYLGDLRRLEGFSQLLSEGAGISAKTIFGLRPGSSLQVDDLNNAYNGDFIIGDLEREVSVLKVDKANDLAVAERMAMGLEQKLSRAFMMMSGNIRDSERTTATEVRATSAELEATFGGTYSVLASELQLPLITLTMNDINPNFEKLTEPTITTGTSAISREKDFNNLNIMLQSIASLGPEVVAEYLDVEGYLKSVSTSLGFDAEVMVKSAEQRQSEQEQRAAQEQAAQPQGQGI